MHIYPLEQLTIKSLVFGFKASRDEFLILNENKQKFHRSG